MVLLAETFRIGTRFALTIRYHEGLSRDGDGERGVSMPIPPEDLVRARRDYYGKVAEWEEGFAEEHRLKRALEVYRALRERLQDPEAFPLRVGFGSGRLALRLALLLSPGVQRALRRLAEEADTTTAKGLADLLDEVALVLIREAPAWRFASYEAREGTEEEVLGQFDAWMLEDRSTYRETFRHFEGKKVEAAYTPKVEPGGRYLVASLVLAVRGSLPPGGPLDRGKAREVLLAFAATTPFTLLAFHLAWTPEKEGEGLTEEELLALYPNLEKL